MAFAATAGLLKEGMDSLNRGFGALFTTWPLYALIVIGALGLLLNQLAFRAGPLRFSLPAITTIDPIASLIIGVAVFDEKFRDGPFYLLGETLGLAFVVAGSSPSPAPILTITHPEPVKTGKSSLPPGNPFASSQNQLVRTIPPGSPTVQDGVRSMAFLEGRPPRSLQTNGHWPGRAKRIRPGEDSQFDPRIPTGPSWR